MEDSVEERLNELIDLPLVSISKEDYNILTFDFIKKYAEKHNFEVAVVMEELSKRFNSDSELEYDKIKKIFVRYEYTTISKLQRLYEVGFHNASVFVDKLIKKKILSPFVYGRGYRILNKVKYDKAIKKLNKH